MRRIALAAGLVAGALLARSAHADPHPYFQDQGTLSWCTCLERAQTAARGSDRLIFIEYGRRECRNCRILVERILPNVKDRIAPACVGLAADCDEPDPRVEAIFRRAMPNASLLPFVAIVTPELAWVTGWEGGIGADEVVRHLQKAEATRRARSTPPTAACPSTRGAVAVGSPAPGGLPVAPTAPARPTWTAADAAKALDLLEQARLAAGRGAQGEVLRLDAEAARLPVRADAATWTSLRTGATGWCERSLSAAVEAARARRCDEATRLVKAVAAEMAGNPAAEDAARGERAIDLAHRIEATPEPGRPRILAMARDTFRGTRWAILFGG